MASDRKSAFRDSHGRTLTDYPRPSVAVDTALLTLEPGSESMAVLQVKRDEGRGWSLPGTFLHEGEQLIDAVLRSLHDKTGVDGPVPRQLRVFDEPDRDDRGWVLSVAHVVVVPTDRLLDRVPTTRLQSVDAPGRLPYGHGAIVSIAVEDVRRRYTDLPDPDHLLPDEFTMLDLRRVHTAVAGRPLQKDTFRRAMEPLVEGTGAMTVGGRGRPAELFRRVV